MAAHGYDSGRLNLPFVGISTFAKSPYVENWDAINADAVSYTHLTLPTIYSV